SDGSPESADERTWLIEILKKTVDFKPIDISSLKIHPTAGPGIFHSKKTVAKVSSKPSNVYQMRKKVTSTTNANKTFALVISLLGPVVLTPLHRWSPKATKVLRQIFPLDAVNPFFNAGGGRWAILSLGWSPSIPVMLARFSQDDLLAAETQMIEDILKNGQ